MTCNAARSSRFRWSIVAIICIAATPVLAEEAGGQEKPEWVEEGRNEIAIFLGVTEAQDFDRGFSVGIEYERRLSGLFGIGAVAEYTGSDLREGIVGITLLFHAWKELTIVAAPAVYYDFTTGDDALVFGAGFARRF